MGTPSDGDSSVAAEIPYRKKGKAADKQLRQDLVKTTNGDDEEDMEEDEYVVERILNHKFTNKDTLTLLVKWQGYPESESTWEPEKNLENCPDELSAYFTELGYKPIPGRPLAATKKRKISEKPSAETPTPPASTKAGRRKNTAARPDADDGYPKGSWEDLILNIDTMEMDDDGIIHIFLVWKTGKKTRHPASVGYSKCPQKCLQFYESHLQFNPPPAKAPPAAAPAPPAAAATERVEASKVDEGYDDEEEDEVDMDVKKVASGA